MTSAGFELRAVSKAYGAHAILKSVSFRIPAGSHTALVGPSGCGKSTVLRLLAGLEWPSAGAVLLNGTVVSDGGRILCAPHLRKIGMVFQDLALWPNLSVMENVNLGHDRSALTNRVSSERAYAALELCGIEPLKDRKPATLSGGQQQRVALARALASEPEYLFLDEPFSGLDLATRSKIIEDVGQLALDQNLTIVLVTHDPQEISALCEVVVVLENGEFIEAGPLGERLKMPRSKTLMAFQAYFKSQPPP
jgi:iron(III) transport system ATP-binding protein